MKEKTNIERIPFPVLWILFVFFTALLCVTTYGMLTDSGVHRPNYIFMSGDEPVVFPDK